MKLLSEVILNIRKEHGLTQQELADRVYVTRQAVSKWECDKSFPGQDVIEKIKNEFDVDLFELITNDDTKAITLNNDINIKKLNKKSDFFMIFSIILSILFFILISFLIYNSLKEDPSLAIDYPREILVDETLKIEYQLNNPKKIMGSKDELVDVKFFVRDDDILKISKDGTIQGLKIGQTIIIITAETKYCETLSKEIMINVVKGEKTVLGMSRYNPTAAISLFVHGTYIGEIVDLKEYIPKNTYYRFLGWSIEPDSKEYIEEIKITEKEMTIYANWEKINISVNLVLNGGAINTNSLSDVYKNITETVSFDSYQNIMVTIPTKRGYDFIGWTIIYNGKTQFISYEELLKLNYFGDYRAYIEEDIVLIANWEETKN